MTTSNVQSTCTSSYNDLLLKALSGSTCTDAEKQIVIDCRQPPAGSKLPSTRVRDQRKQSGFSERFLQRKQSGFSERFLQRQYCNTFEWLGYYDGSGDLEKAGVFCVACTLFPVVHREGSRRAEYLVSKVQTNFKKLREDAARHDCLEYHRDSVAKWLSFRTTADQPSMRLEGRMSEATMNRIETVEIAVSCCLSFDVWSWLEEKDSLCVDIVTTSRMKHRKVTSMLL